MLIIEPINVINRNGISIENNITISETLWQSGVTYSKGAKKYIAENFNLYEALSTTSDNPLIGIVKEEPTWKLLGKINKYKMHYCEQKSIGSYDTRTISALNTNITGRIYGQKRFFCTRQINYICFLNVTNVVSVNLTMKINGGQAYNVTKLQSNAIDNTYNVLFSDIPDASSSDLIEYLFTITKASSESYAYLGEIVLGEYIVVGDTQLNSSIRIEDYTKKEINPENGLLEIINGNYMFSGDYDIIANKSDMDYIHRALARLRNKTCAYIGDSCTSAFMHLGLFKTYNIIVSYPTMVILNMNVVGFHNLPLGIEQSATYSETDMVPNVPKQALTSNKKVIAYFPDYGIYSRYYEDNSSNAKGYSLDFYAENVNGVHAIDQITHLQWAFYTPSMNKSDYQYMMAHPNAPTGINPPYYDFGDTGLSNDRGAYSAGNSYAIGDVVYKTSYFLTWSMNYYDYYEAIEAIGIGQEPLFYEKASWQEVKAWTEELANNTGFWPYKTLVTYGGLNYLCIGWAYSGYITPNNDTTNFRRVRWRKLKRQGEVIPSDIDMEELHGKGTGTTYPYAVTTLEDITTINNKLKITLSIGGWTLSGNLSKVAASSTARGHLISSVLFYCHYYDFDGIDIDWEFVGMQGIGYNYVHNLRPDNPAYPAAIAQGLSNTTDKTNLATLFSELSNTVNDYKDVQTDFIQSSGAFSTLNTLASGNVSNLHDWSGEAVWTVDGSSEFETLNLHLIIDCANGHKLANKKQRCTMYCLTPLIASNAPKQWKLYGANNSDFSDSFLIHHQNTDVNNWVDYTEKAFYINAENHYRRFRYFKFVWTKTNNASNLLVGIGYVKLANNRLLSLGGAVGASVISTTNWQNAFTYMDNVVLMTYDLAGAWDTVTGHQSPFEQYSDYGTPEYSQKSAVDRVVALGCPKSKIVLGLPFYGRGWKGVTLTSPTEIKGSASNGAVSAITKQTNTTYIEDGISDYTDILKGILDGSLVRVWEGAPIFSPFVKGKDRVTNEDTVWTFFDNLAVKHRCEYIKTEGMAGIAFWDMSGDTKTLYNSTKMQGGDQYNLLDMVCYVLNAIE